MSTDKSAQSHAAKTDESAFKKIVDSEKQKLPDEAHAFGRSTKMPRSPFVATGDSLPDETRYWTAKKLGLPAPETSPPLLERIAASLNQKSPHLGKETEALVTSFLGSPTKNNEKDAQPAAKAAPVVDSAKLQLMGRELEAAKMAHVKDAPKRTPEEIQAANLAYQEAKAKHLLENSRQAAAFEEVVSSRRSSPVSRSSIGGQSCSDRQLASDTAKTYSRFAKK